MPTSKGRIEIDSTRCKGCGLCISVCPNENLQLKESVQAGGAPRAVFYDQESCTGCRFCAFICPDVAIEVYRFES